MTKKRKFYPTKKLGELRRDVKIEDKKEFIKRIIKYKEKNKTVSADYKKKFGKHLPRSTFNDWRNKGMKYLDEKNVGVNCRITYKQSDIKKEFEQMVMERIKSSKTDVEGSVGVLLILGLIKKSELF